MKALLTRLKKIFNKFRRRHMYIPEPPKELTYTEYDWNDWYPSDAP